MNGCRPERRQHVTQLHRDGLTPTLADNSVVDGIRQFSSLLATDRLKVHRRWDGLINEIPGYSWGPRQGHKGRGRPD